MVKQRTGNERPFYTVINYVNLNLRDIGASVDELRGWADGDRKAFCIDKAHVIKDIRGFLECVPELAALFESRKDAVAFKNMGSTTISSPRGSVPTFVLVELWLDPDRDLELTETVFYAHGSHSDTIKISDTDIQAAYRLKDEAWIDLDYDDVSMAEYCDEIMSWRDPKPFVIAAYDASGLIGFKKELDQSCDRTME